jgi:hypothetical protein
MSRRKNVIVPNDEKALVAMEKMAVDIQKARELYGDGEPFDEERVLDCIVFKAEQSSKALEDLGKYCLWLKEEVGHGRFLAGLKRRNLNSTAANWAMLMYEKFGSNSAHVQNLGVRRARVLAVFSKEEINTYAEGGPLGSIPHDDVSDMPIQELEAEVRKLREKVKRVEDVAKEKLRQKDEQITKLEFEIEKRQPPTKEQIAIAGLAELDKGYFSELTAAMAAMRKATEILNQAQCVPGVNGQILNEWINKYNEEMVLLNGVHEELTGMIDDLHPIAKGKIKEEV